MLPAPSSSYHPDRPPRDGERFCFEADSDPEGRRADSSEADVKEDVEPVSEGLRGTFSVEDLRLFPFRRLEHEQLLGTLIMHLLWKFRPQPGTERKH